jgi:protease-4
MNLVLRTSAPGVLVPSRRAIRASGWPALHAAFGAGGARHQRAPPLPPRSTDQASPLPTEESPAADTAAPPEAAAPPEIEYVPRTPFEQTIASVRLAFALPWRRFKSGSALALKLGGAIPEEPQGRFSSTLSLPSICDCLTKAAYDPRIAGVVVKIDPLSVGWAKVIEIRRHVELFRRSGKWAVAYLERAGEKEYFLASAFGEIYAPPTASLSLRGLAVTGTFLRGALDKVGVSPEVRRIGKYKSAGDQLLRSDMSGELLLHQPNSQRCVWPRVLHGESRPRRARMRASQPARPCSPRAEPQREQLSALLDDIFDDFTTTVASSRGKSREEFEALLDAGVYDMETFASGGWVTELKYEDELNDLVKARTGGKEDELRAVGWRRYARVGRGALGLGGGGSKAVAIVRTSGAITGGSGGAAGSITAGAVIAQLRALKKNKRVAAVVLRVDSPGGDALASDLMWREIQQLSAEKPVIASMGDVAASGGYYMAMACRKIVAEALTITGSVGVIAGKFSLGQLYEKLGYSKEIISRGRYAQLLADNRLFSEDEAALFDASAQHAYESFRDKAAASRGLTVEAMQEVAQGRVWSGRRAAGVGLVDELGGINRALALAKEAAGIPAGERTTTLEVSRAPFSPLALVTGGGGASASWLVLLAQAVLGGGGGLTPAAALGVPALAQALLAASGSAAVSVADEAMMQGLAAGRVVAQLPELSVEGVASRALLAGERGAGERGATGSELFDC